MVRKPKYAGLFYPDDKDELNKIIDSLLDNVLPKNITGIVGLIAPHAGYVYSGPVAASGYKEFLNLDKDKKYEVVVVAPSHNFYFKGIAISSFDYYKTPLGDIKVNKEAILPDVSLNIIVSDAAHIEEHSLEVQLPFLQKVLKNFEIIPIITGEISKEELSLIFKSLYKENRLFIISSDLSHYYPYAEARKIDKNCIDGVLDFDFDILKNCEACGLVGIKGFINFAKNENLEAILLDYRTSGDTYGPKTEVVGYMSVIIRKK